MRNATETNGELFVKKETYAAKLAALLGIEEKHEEYKAQEKIRKGNLTEVPEDKIQDFRQAQGITYFLQAPALFQPRVCKHCGASYLVSRMYVAYCSYTCIKASLNNMGLEWRRGDDIEALVESVYEGQEPIWIRNIEQLKLALERLTDLASKESLSS